MLTDTECDVVAKAGREAGRSGQSWQVNPYPCDTEEHEIWYDAWEAGTEIAHLVEHNI